MNASADPTLSENPYVGPRTFTEEERDRFFGRDREAGHLLTLASAERLVLFYAESGSGKSSLINARLIPDLRAVGFEVLPTGRVGGEIPREKGIDPAAINNIFIFNLILSVNQGMPEDERQEPASLVGLSLEQFLGGDDATLAPEASDAEQYIVPPHMLIIDQFEEILATHLDRWQDRVGFFEQLGEAMTKHPQLWVLLVMREDYLAGLDPYAYLLPSRLRFRFYMERMSLSAALDAIQKPALKGGRTFAPEAADKLVKNLAQIRIPGQQSGVIGESVEPVQLQIVCQNFWNKLPKNTKKITEKHVNTIGNADQALTNFYVSCIRKAVDTFGVAEEKLRNLFDKGRLITPAGTKGMVFKDAEKGETEQIPNKAMELLAGMHLIREEWRSGSQWYELTHDRFIQPILESNRAFLLNKASDPYMDILRDLDKSQLPARIELIGNSGDERAVEPLMPFIGSDEPDIRRAAIRALGILRSPKAVERLLEVLKDNDNTAREEAIMALGRIGDLRAVDPLVSALQDQNEKIAISAVRALENLGWKPANDHQKGWYFFAKKDWQASVELGLPSLQPLVWSLRKTDIAARVNAIKALGEIGDVQALEPLIGAFQDTDATVRKAAIQAIGKLDHQRAFQFLIDILQGNDSANDQSIRLLALDTVLMLSENAVVSSLLKKYADDKSVKLTDEMSAVLSVVGLRDPLSL